MIKRAIRFILAWTIGLCALLVMHAALSLVAFGSWLSDEEYVVDNVINEMKNNRARWWQWASFK